MRTTLLVAVIALATTLSWTQTSTTSLRGTISDSKGAVLPGATVTIIDASTGFTRSAATDSQGAYQFLQIPPATYSLTATARGFATLKQDDVRLLVGTPATLNLTLGVQGEAVTVEVKGEAKRSTPKTPPWGMRLVQTRSKACHSKGGIQLAS
jgi:hypothetical protein